MKLLCVMILSIVSATNLLADDATKQSDEYFKKTIVGTWQIQINVHGVDVHIVETYSPNGQMDQKAKIRYPNGVIETSSAKRSWYIKNAVLILKLESVTPIGMVPIGQTEKYKILKGTKKQFSLFFLSSNYGRGKAVKVLFLHRVKSQSGKGDI